MDCDVLICGAGIAGVSTAYHLTVRHGIQGVVLVDERPPLSLTSDKSTECYRNWWPGPDSTMIDLMNRSIDLLEELAQQSGNIFHLNRRGYLYLTADPENLEHFSQIAREPPRLGAGPLRIHSAIAGEIDYLPAPPEGFQGLPDGADLFLEPGLIRKYFPYLSNQVIAALHVRRAGWFSAQQLGMYLLEQARKHGASVIEGKVTGVDIRENRVRSVVINAEDRINTPIFINAAGPNLKNIGILQNIDLPVYSELHLKVSIRDHFRAIPRHAPLLIWNDRQILPWSDEEKSILAEDPETRWLLGEMPSGVHTRPEGGNDSDAVLLLWEYHVNKVDPVFPPPLDEQYPEIALRGLMKMLPGLQVYLGRSPRPYLDGGYYTKTSENRPLIGPTHVEGSYLIGALSGYGLMASCAAGELLAKYISNSVLPSYAPSLSLNRYQDPNYVRMIQNLGASGQL